MRRHVALTVLAAATVASGAASAVPAAATTADGTPLSAACAPVKDLVVRVDGADANANYPKPLTSEGKLPGQYDVSAALDGICGQADYPEPLHVKDHDHQGQLIGGLPVGG